MTNLLRRLLNNFGLPAAVALCTLLAVAFSSGLYAAVVQDLMTMARRGLPGSETFDLHGVVTEYLESPEHRIILATRPGARCTATIGTAPLRVAGSRIALFKAPRGAGRSAVRRVGPGPGRNLGGMRPRTSPFP